MKKESMIGRRLYAWLFDTMILLLLAFFFEGFVNGPMIQGLPEVQETLVSYENHWEEYRTLQDEYDVYVYDADNNRVYNQGITEEGLNAFKNNEEVKVLSEKIYKEQNILINYLVIRICLDLAFSSVIVYLIIPLIAKQGRTIGKLIAKLAIADNNNEYAKWYLVGARYLLSIILNVYLTLFTIGIVPLVNLLISIGQKDNKSINDLICQTKVVDNKIPLEIQNM